MAFTNTVRNGYQTEIEGIKAAGLFKGERYIHSPQGSEIEVEFPVGSEIRKCINICANNYLGLHGKLTVRTRSGYYPGQERAAN